MPKRAVKRVAQTVRKYRPNIDAAVGHARKHVPKGKSRAVGRAIGGFLGGKFGGPGRAIGNALGGMGGDLFSRITGVGDYHINHNSLLSGRTDGVPVMHSAGGSVRVQHVEYIGNITSTQLFNNTIYPIQPSNQTTFPWLSSMAVNFEQWRAHGIVFYFKSMSSDTQISTTVSLGQIILATEYNALAPGFTTEQQMLNSQWSCSTKPSQHVTHYIECAQSQTPSLPLYTYNPNDAPLGDLRLYNLGNFQLATIGMQPPDDQVLGQLFISYDIELLKPVLAPSLDSLMPFAYAAQASGTGDCTTGFPYGFDGNTYSLTKYGMTATFNTAGWQFKLINPGVAKNVQLTYIWQFNGALITPATIFGSFNALNCTPDPAIPLSVTQTSDQYFFTIVCNVIITDPYETFHYLPVAGSGFVFTGNASLSLSAFPYNRQI